MTDFTDSGANESTKGAVHGAVMTLAALCGVYNGAAWMKRREPHLAINVLVYSLLVGFEAYQVTQHRQRAAYVIGTPDCRPPGRSPEDSRHK